MFLSRSITRPIAQLALFANQIKNNNDEQKKLINFPKRHDEIGQLSSAFLDMTSELHNRIKATGKFAADVSHELKNPLTSLKSAIETFSKTKNLNQTLNQKKQAMIFINRRGFAPQFICSYCDWKAMCNSCDSSLVFHYQASRLICHRCDSAFGVPTHCPSCSKAQLSFHGTGTEQLEKTLKEIFPN